ncbi:MAG: hypothetical protein JSU61_02630, partial [Fidelibacterota bacterium]
MSIRFKTISYLGIGLIFGAGGLAGKSGPFYMDIGLFRATEDQSRIEVYLGIERQQLRYEPIQSRYRTELAAVVLVKQRGHIVDFKELSVEDVIDRVDDPDPGVISRQATFVLEAGKYNIQAVVEDSRGRQYEEISTVEVPVYSGKELAISTIEPAQLIRRVPGQKEFSKSGLVIIPNAAVSYNATYPLLWYYAEIYGLTPLDMVALRTVIKKDDAAVITLEDERTPSPALIFHEWGAINISGLAEGDYQLSIVATVDEDTVRGIRTFRVEGDTVAAPDTMDVLTALSAADRMRFARGLSKLPADLDIQKYRSGDLAAKDRLIREAVDQLASDLEGDPGSVLAELIRTWPRATAFEPNWRNRRRFTEQGRTVFLHDLPATIETYPATSLRREHHIWTYVDQDRTDTFVFVDQQGYGRFTLAHATVPGTLTDENWERRVSWVPVPVDAPAKEHMEEVRDEIAAPPVVEPELAEPVPADSAADVMVPALQDTFALDSDSLEAVAL